MFKKNNWINTTLGDISLVKGQYGANEPSVKLLDGNPRYIRITDIDEEGLLIEKNAVSAEIENIDTFLVEENDLLFVRTGSTTGKCYLHKEKDKRFTFAGFLIKFKINEEIANPYYVWSITKTARYNEWVSIMSVRSGQPGINSTEYSKLNLLLPPLDEQKKIADILSTWDDKINRLIKLIDVQENYREVIVKLLITKYHNQKLIKKEYKHLKYYLNSKNEKVLDRDIEPVAVGVNGIRLRSEIYDKELSDDYSNNKVIRQNDLCFGIGTNNIVYDVLLEDKVYCVSPAYKVYEIDKIDAFYLKSYLDTFNEYYSKKYMIISSRQGKSVDMKGLLNEKIYAPSYEEQLKFSKVIHTIDDYIDLLKEELEAVKLQKQGLMQQLLTGKIRVNTD